MTSPASAPPPGGESGTPGIDWLTVAAISVTMYIAANVIHEGLGHAGACVLIGATPLELSTAHFHNDPASTTMAGEKFIAASAAILNVITGLLALMALRFSPGLRSTARYALWLFMTVSLLAGTGYPLFSGVMGVGDYATLIEGWQPAWAWRVGSIVVGLALYMAAVVLCLRELARFIGTGGVARVRRASRTNLIAYLAGSTLSTAGALLNPHGAILLATSAAASFGGTSGLAWMSQLYHDRFAEKEPPEPFAIPRSWPWIATGAVILAVHIGVLGPAVYF